MLRVETPDIAMRAKAGQFVITQINEEGERIPITISDYDREKGTIDLIFQEIGKTTIQLGRLDENDFIAHVAGPLGKPSEIMKFGSVICVGGGVGIAAIYPIARALYEAGNNVTNILGARTKDLLILEDKMRTVSNRLYLTTDDGTKGHHGVVTDVLKQILEKEKIDRVVAVGPTIMMKFVSQTTKSFGVKTIVSLNPIMIDGTGMCGGCRISVGGETKFACCDGPEFDGHLVDFDNLLNRLKQYIEEEKISSALEKN